MILRSSPTSPFGRKIKITLNVLGLADKVSVVLTDTLDPEDTIRQQNPLGKVPTLLLDDGTTLYDSRVIVEYLDDLAGGGRILPDGGTERYRALTLQSLADGIMDAALLMVYEARVRPEDKRFDGWLEGQWSKVTRALDVLESRWMPHLNGPIDMGGIAVGCALGYLAWRFPHLEWRRHYPNLGALVDKLSARPSFADTLPPAN